MTTKSKKAQALVPADPNVDLTVPAPTATPATATVANASPATTTPVATAASAIPMTTVIDFASLPRQRAAGDDLAPCGMPSAATRSSSERHATHALMGSASRIARLRSTTEPAKWCCEEGEPDGSRLL